MELGEIIPYGSVFIDSSMSDIIQATKRCFSRYTEEDKAEIKSKLSSLFTSDKNKNFVFPCYSVRTGIDLFFTCQQFPPGSEVIMSAINIPDMIRIVKHHKLKPIPVDIDIDTVSVDPKDLELAISAKTVAIIVAHIYGKWINVDSLIEVANAHNLIFIEDCAESFCGFENLGHPRSHLTLFSFGTIKTCTSFGGAILKIRDEYLYNKMLEKYSEYPIHTQREYLNKLQKCILIYHMLNVPCLVKRSMELTRMFNIDHQKLAVHLMRGFNSDDLLTNVRKQPCGPLLDTMLQRLSNFDQEKHEKEQLKANYVKNRLPSEMKPVGSAAKINSNSWLFPVLTDDPPFVITMLRKLGVDAYIGSTQLDVVCPDDCQIPEVALSEEQRKVSSSSSLISVSSSSSIPERGKYLMDHVIYLPVHKRVPYKLLDKICFALHVVAAKQKLMSIAKLDTKSKL